jgi:hypothetical protein
MPLLSELFGLSVIEMTTDFLLRIPSEPLPPPVKEPPPDAPENPDIPVREPDPDEPAQI